MKIVNRKTFLSLPPKTVYCEYRPCAFDSIKIKEETISQISEECYGDYFYTGTDCPFICSDSADHSEMCRKSEKGQEIDLDFTDIERDGCYQEDQLYAVFSNKDVEGLISRLKECIKAE